MLEALFSPGALGALLQVLMIDLVLAGDNAVAVGIVAASLPAQQRRRVIFWGLVAAVAIRIGFALIATELMGLIGLMFAGGLLLLWVCWKMWRELRAHGRAQAAHGRAVLAAHPESEHLSGPAPRTFRAALLQILVADVSMSLDNVLAVAGAAREHPAVLALGLLLSVALMGVAANGIARMLHRFQWIGYLGLAVVVYVALHMMWQGHRDLVQDLGKTAAYNQLAPAPLDIKPETPDDAPQRAR
jgi:YjbE family integral membrane protein